MKVSQWCDFLVDQKEVEAVNSPLWRLHRTVATVRNDDYALDTDG